MSPEIMLIISFITKILGSVGPGFGGCNTLVYVIQVLAGSMGVN
jgi:hypothetical protein